MGKAMKRFLISVALLVAFVASAQSPYQVMVNPTNNVIVSPSGVLISNLVAGSGITLTLTDGKVQIDSSGGGGGGGGGSVTSVGLSTTLSGLSVGSSPVTSSGTMTLSGTLGIASGGTGATDASGVRTALSLVPGTDVQAYDTDLAAIAALANSGIVVRTGSGTVSARTITGDSEISVTNGDGVSGNPTLAIGAAIARLASPSFTGTPTVPTASSGTSNTVAASTAYVDRAVASGGGGGGTAIATNWFVKPSVSGALTTLFPQPIAAATNSTWSPDFSAGRVHRVTMSGNLTLSVPAGVSDDMIGQTFLLILQQDSTGGRSVSAATNYMFGQEITSIGVSTNAGSRSYVTVCVLRTNVLDVLGNLTGYTQ